MDQPQNRPQSRAPWKLARLAFLLLPLMLLACGGGDSVPVGEWFKGNTTLVRIEEMHRVPEVRYPRPAGQAIRGDTLIIDIEDIKRVPEIRYGRLVGPAVTGDTLIISIEDIQRLQEMRYQGADGTHYVIAPSTEDNELVAVQVNVQNPEAEPFSLTVGEDTAELRGFGANEAYRALGVTLQNERNVVEVDDSHPSENLFTPLLAGQVDLPGDHSVIGWVLFEAPKDLQLREMTWEGGGDAVTLAIEENHFVVVPANEDNDLVALRLNVHNTGGEEPVSLIVGEETAELWGFESDERYKLLDVTPRNEQNVAKADGSHPSENLYAPFIRGAIDLPQGHSVIGWVVFEVPKDTQLRELKWEGGGDTVYVGTTQSHFLVAPTGQDTEILAVRLAVHNAEAARVVLSINEESAEIRGREFDERYKLIDLFRPETLYGTNVDVVEGSHITENLYTPFLIGPIDLPQGHSVTGWLLFEVPKDIKLQEMRWEAGGDVIFVDRD